MQYAMMNRLNLSIFSAMLSSTIKAGQSVSSLLRKISFVQLKTPSLISFCLDIEMTAPTGFEAAKQLVATQNPRPLIIFITKSNAYTIKGYGVAFRYLVKPIAWDDFALALDAALDELSANRFSFSYNNDLVSIPLQSIYYIESFAHVAVIHTANDEFHIRATLSEVKQNLPLSRFTAPHKSYLVNMSHINTVLSDDIILTNGDRIPISRRKRQEFNADFCRFLGR